MSTTTDAEAFSALQAALRERDQLSIAEARVLAGTGGKALPESTFYKLENSGHRLKSFKIGRARITRPAYVREWVAQIEQSTGASPCL